jgi:hypothetical protein
MAEYRNRNAKKNTHKQNWNEMEYKMQHVFDRRVGVSCYFTFCVVELSMCHKLVFFNFHPEYHEVISHFVRTSAEANGEKHARILLKAWVVWN